VVAVTRKRFTVKVRRDPEDRTAWLVNVVGSPGAHTFGRSLSEAKRHAVEVVALCFDLEPTDFEIDWDIRLGSLATPVKRARDAMAHAEADRVRETRPSASSLTAASAIATSRSYWGSRINGWRRSLDRRESAGARQGDVHELEAIDAFEVGGVARVER
jgi:predicted RNase H-like HicB family nuclease